jgi:hypothetical protein
MTRRRPSRRQGPTPQTLQQRLPQRSDRLGQVHQQPPRVFDHAGAHLEHRPLKSSQVPATAQVILQLTTQQRCQVEEDRDIFRQLAARIELEAPPQQLVAATRQAIANATDFDERDSNRNFSYDYEAYSEVKRNLSRLIDLGQFRLATELSLELMKQGSYQVEMSDEGLMAEDIEESFRVVLQALKKCDLPPSEMIAWCAEMLKRDRVGFICKRELEALQSRFEALRPQ